MVFDPLTKALDLLMGSQLVKDKLQRNEHVIRFLKQLGLSPDQPPADFEGVYAYALVEYGVGKPKPCLEIFRQSEIRKIFRTAFGDNNAQLWLRSGEQFLDQSAIGQAVRSIGLDPKRELAAFAACFITVTKQTRNPSEVLLSHQVSSVQQQIQQVIERLDRLPSLEGIRTELASLAGSEAGLLPATLSQGQAQSCRAFALGQQMRGWFETLGYRFESYEVWETNYFEWIINIPVRRGRYDRVLVRGVDGEVGIRDVRSLAAVAAQQKTDEGWIVTARRISQAARNELEQLENQPDCEPLAAFTLDELLDQDADFSGYLDWLAAEIEQRGIEARYVPLACTKEEVDPITHQRLGISRYGAAEGWTEGYLDRWLDDPAKEHLSILGEFGTGKTWLTLHYAAQVLRQYREAQAKGMARPRLPIVVPLRDYAKAVSVESLFSEFFFRKHEIPIPGYSAFEQLNRMGKLLLIFDGFDEMAARVDKQQMINNFWELAKVVVPGAKVILTCRTEHFPEAREGRALLNAELQASTRDLTGETPQFEVLELEKFDDEQIRQVLQLQAAEATVDQVMGNPQLLDLARRPVMTELILEALPDIEAGKPVDMSRVYLYAVRRKMERDIKAERTFTSMADKLYFLCELSWEMLSTDRMSLNYREFPDRIRKLFGSAVQEEKDLDHWHYDMMGQTMLIRNADGDYTPAHRSLLEFFVAYKFAAELGALAPDFLELSQMRGDIDRALEPREYTWSEYFETRDQVAPLASFKTESLERLHTGIGASLLAKVVFDLTVPMLQVNNTEIETQKILLNIIKTTIGKLFSDLGYLGGNVATLMLSMDRSSLSQTNLSQAVIAGVDFTDALLHNTNFTKADLRTSSFATNFASSWTLAISPNEELLATGHCNGEIRIWKIENGELFSTWKGHLDVIQTIVFSPDGQILASGSSDHTIKLWDIQTEECINTIQECPGTLITGVIFSPDSHTLASCGDDYTIKLWDIKTGECLRILQGHLDIIRSVAFASDETILVSGSYDQKIKIWDLKTGQCLKTLQGHLNKIRSVAIRNNTQIIASGGEDCSIKVWNFDTGHCLMTLYGHSHIVRTVAFSRNGNIIVSGSADKTIKIWDANTGQCLKTLKGHTNWIRSVSTFSNMQFLVSTSDDQTIKFWNLITGECLRTLQGYNNCISTIAFSPNGNFLASGSDDNLVRLWDAHSGECLKVFTGHRNFVFSVAFSPDGRILASGSDDETVNIWNVETGECLKTFHGHSNLVTSVVFSPDGKTLASCSDDHTIMLWDLQNLQLITTFKGHSRRVYSITFSLNGKMLASASKDATIKLWNVETGQCLRTLVGHINWVQSVIFHPNGRTIASGGDYTVKLWDIFTGECIRTFEGHTNHVSSISFTPDGQIIASSSEDHTIRLWDVHQGSCLKVLFGHSDRVRSIMFHPTGQIIASSSNDETIKLWDVKTSKCLKTLRNSSPYKGMNITGVKGLTPATIASLKALGAVEDEE